MFQVIVTVIALIFLIIIFMDHVTRSQSKHLQLVRTILIKKQQLMRRNLLARLLHSKQVSNGVQPILNNNYLLQILRIF